MALGTVKWFNAAKRYGFTARSRGSWRLRSHQRGREGRLNQSRGRRSGELRADGWSFGQDERRKSAHRLIGLPWESAKLWGF